MISVVIPAHNEEKVIARTIKALLPGCENGEFEVIVVCNGCTDESAKIVSSFGASIKLIESPVPSKTNALNLGDTEASGFPRFYQDADVVLTVDTIKRVAGVLASGQFLAVAPQMQMDYAHSSWAVRSFYDVWQNLPYVKEGMIGTGVYALSKEGRARFDRFPDVIADDGYVRALFKANERACVETCRSIVRAPTNIEGLIKIKTRSRLGGYELWEKFPDLKVNEEKPYGNAILGLLRDIKLWPKIPVYFYVNLVARLRAKKYLRMHGTVGWERDESSRDID